MTNSTPSSPPVLTPSITSGNGSAPSPSGKKRLMNALRLKSNKKRVKTDKTGKSIVQATVPGVTAGVSTLQISSLRTVVGASTIAPRLEVPTSRSTSRAASAGATFTVATGGPGQKINTAAVLPSVSAASIGLGASSSGPNVKRFVTFPKNPERMTQVPVMSAGQRFETTTQLVHYARLLQGLRQSSLPPVEKLSSYDRQWIIDIENDSLEQARICQRVIDLVKEFLLLTVKDSNAVHEIVLVSSVLDKDSYRALLRCFLETFNKGSILDPTMLLGLVQIMENAPSDYAEVDDLVKVLVAVGERLETTAKQSPGLVLYLTQAVSRVLGVLADQKVKDLDRVKTHTLVGTALSGLKISDHPYLKYQSMHARQALKEVPNDETRSECIFRHFVNVTGSLIKISRVMQMDFDGFAKGVKEAQKNLKEVYDFLKDGWDDATALKKNGQSIFNDLGATRSWFTSLRVAEDYIQQGQLVELSAFINTAPRCEHEHFQWGICQLFGEIVTDSSWDAATRGCCIDHLDQIYSTTLHSNIKRWILTLLGCISELSTIDRSIKLQAATLIQKMITDNIQPFTSPWTLSRRLPLPTSFKLLEIVNNMPDLEPRLHIIQSEMKMKQLEDRRLDVYVSLMSKVSLKASSTENLVPLQTRVTQFLASKNEVLLILGDSGAGKSTFNIFFQYKLWSEYKPGDQIPLFVDLKAMGSLKDVDMIKTKLHSLNFDDAEIKEMKRSRDLILICDGYDECGQWINIHTRLKSQLGWRSIKLVITCRTQYLESMADRIIFQPEEDGQMAFQESKLFEEAVIVPFDEGQVGNCIGQFVETEEAKSVVFMNEPVWTADEYLEHFKSLADLVKNPYMLQIALRILPKMAKDGPNLSGGKLTRFELYDEFTKQHFQKELVRLTNGQSAMDMDEKRAFGSLRAQFYHYCMGYSKRLAHMAFTKNDGVNAIEYSTAGEEESWKDNFFYHGVDSKAVQLKLLRNSSQLISYSINESGPAGFSESTRTMYLFPHRSLLEFFYACQICDFQDSVASRRFFENSGYHNLTTDLASTTIPSLVAIHPLNKKKIMSEPSIINFLVEYAQKNSMFKDQLYKVILLSRSDENVCQAAANAITILIQGGHRFNNQDLRGIRIRGANLTGGQFDNTQLQGADLRDCILRNTWLRKADLSHAKMENVQFGEWSYNQDGKVRCCAYSSNGRTFACGLEKGVIKVIDTSTWTNLYAIEAHSNSVSSVRFSPDGFRIASGSKDCTVRLWDAQTGALERILEGHEDYVHCVVYSPNGKQIASASKDMTVRIWDTETGKMCMLLNDHTSSVRGVAYSPDGQQIATGGDDAVIRLWNARGGSICHILKGHTHAVASVVYSPNGERIGSGSYDHTVRLWNASTGELERVLKGHAGCISSIAFSPTSQQIVAGGGDGTVRLWDTQTGAPGSILRGHEHDVLGVAYSPDGQKIASAGFDGSVRLWDPQFSSPDLTFDSCIAFLSDLAFSPNGHQIVLSNHDGTVQLRDATTGACTQVLRGHTDIACCVAYSPSGLQIVSASEDQTLRIWDATTGDPGPILNGHSSVATAVLYSPNGQQIASASCDRIVRLWDAQTGALIHILESSIGAVEGVVFSPTGSQIASWVHSTVELWDLEMGQLDRVLNSPGEIISDDDDVACVYSPSGQHIVVCGGCNVWLWDTQSGVQVFEHHLKSGLKRFAKSVTYSPCGKHVAIGEENGDVGLWDTQTGVMARIMKGHTEAVWSVAYSPDGEFIASGSDDYSLRVWDVHSGVCLAVIGFAGEVIKVLWSATADGIFIALKSGDCALSVCQVVETEGQTKVHLLWTTSVVRLHASNAIIQNVHGLSRVNRELLEQRGAVVDDDESESEESIF